MLDLFAVFTTGGIILWSYSPAAIGVTPANNYCKVISHIMHSVVIDGTALGTSMVLDTLCLHWSIHQDLGLVFLVVSLILLSLHQ